MFISSYDAGESIKNDEERNIIIGGGTLLLFLQAQLTLPSLFSDNMVIQREAPIKVWGCATPGEIIEAQFRNERKQTHANNQGQWTISFRPSEYGGPYELSIKGTESEIIYRNVMIGDVWLCSGQSNMQMTVKNTLNSFDEIAKANYPQIRLFTVGQNIAFTPSDNVEGSWSECSPATVGDFSAVGYYFGKEIFNKTQIPIGLICSSWGGTVAETWTSMETMGKLSRFQPKIKEMRQFEKESFIKDNQLRKEQFERAMHVPDTGLKYEWFKEFPDNTLAMHVPLPWSKTPLNDMDGIVWFHCEFELQDSVDKEAAILSLGKIDDTDMTWINGVLVGASSGYENFRYYIVRENTLKEGVNHIVVRVVDYNGDGGLYSSNEDLFLKIGNKRYPLHGKWKYYVSVDSRKYNLEDFMPNAYPSLLYNAMIAPIVPSQIKGTIWYQGESNDYDTKLYAILFPNLIKDWRQKWGYDFPFYWAQLANFRQPDILPADSKWAEIREVQTKALALSKTGQAVTIDIGESNDIHPRNKKEVGVRLALHALKNEYGFDNIVAASPVFKKMEIMKDTILVSFDNVGSGLISNDGSGCVRGFAISGDDEKYVWAKAHIRGDKVVVYNENVKKPVFVRYAWSDNPGNLTLYSKEGLPATPFRTDTNYE